MCYNGFSRKINLFKYKSHFKAYSKHELSTINMLSVSQKKLSYYTPTSPKRPPLHNGHFPLSKGGRCGEVRLYSVRTPTQLLLLIATAITLMFHREQILQTSDDNFFASEKHMFMTPHNTGGRDDLLLRFRTRTFPQLL